MPMVFGSTLTLLIFVLGVSIRLLAFSGLGLG